MKHRSALIGGAVIVGIVSLGTTVSSADPLSSLQAETAQAQPVKQAAPPVYQSTWKLELPAGTQRVAVAALSDDTKPRLLVLDDKGMLSVVKITVSPTAEVKSEKDGEIDLGKDAAKFVVGQFAKGGPTMVVVPGALFYRDGGQYKRKALSDLTNLTGSAVFSDGSEGFFSLTPGTAPIVYTVDLTAEKPLKSGKELPPPSAKGGAFRQIVAQFPKEMFDSAPFPEPMKKGALARLLDIFNDTNIYGIVAWQTAEGAYVAVVDGADLFPEPKTDLKPVWKSAKMAGGLLDIAIGADPQDPKKRGIYVLQAGDAGKQKPFVEFFTLK